MIGTHISHYQITAKIGQGGMGEVYRATDTKLDREVAIKVLPESFSRDPERLARFEREAKTLAQLSHPNIASVYGLEQAGDTRALIMEMIKGEDLSDRIKHGSLSIEESLDIAKQIAEALEAAHEKGIVHRDLKPGNVKLDENGHVIVLDFGLAKALTDHNESSTNRNDEDSPTITDAFTKPGTILGTAAYMSPEQARGKQVDKRSDIWAFGCVLYECLTGKRAFQGDDVTETLASIIRGEPDWSDLPSKMPPMIQLLLRKCLAKDRRQRLQDIADGRIDLQHVIQDPNRYAFNSTNEATLESQTTQGIPKSIVTLGFLAITLVTAALTWSLKPDGKLSKEPTQKPNPKRSDLLVSHGLKLFNAWKLKGFTLSNNGYQIVYVLWDRKGLRIRHLETGRDQIISGTEDIQPVSPFFSAKGDQVGFISGNDRSLYSVSVQGGIPRKLASDDQFFIWTFGGADWSQDGHIVFATSSGGLQLISEEGKERKTLTEPAIGEMHDFPIFLDQGRRVAFRVSTQKKDVSEEYIEVVDTVTLDRKRLDIGSYAEVRWTSTGHLLCSTGSELYALPFDLEKLEPMGPRSLVLSDIRNSNRAQFEVSEDGSMVYLPGHNSTTANLGLFWIDSGMKVSPYTQHEGQWEAFALSPDQKRAALIQEKDLWLLDTRLNDAPPPRPLVKHPATDNYPVWSADGETIFFYSDREHAEGNHGVWKIKTNFDGSTEALVYGSESIALYPSSASKNHLILIEHQESSNRMDIWKLALDEPSAKPEPFLTTPFMEFSARISPDEKWLAYTSNETGRNAVYIIPMDRSSGSQIVSPKWGMWPRWAMDGSRLFWFRSGFYEYVDWSDTKGFNQLGQSLFDDSYLIKQWEVASDGTRPVVLAEAANMADPETLSSGAPLSFKMISNWFTELEKKSPVGSNLPQSSKTTNKIGNHKK